MVSSLFRVLLLLGSAWVLWILLGASIIALAAFFDRWRFLRNQEKVGALLWEQQLSNWYTDGLPASWVAQVANLSKHFPCLESRILYALSKQNQHTPEGIERIGQSIFIKEKIQLEKNLGILGTLGNSAPFMGLFGTVLGIIKAFAELDKATGNTGLMAVSEGLAEALVTTAAGLFVAIPCVIAYNFFQKKIKIISSRCTSLVGLIAGGRA